MQILFIGDVFGQPGRDALLRWLPGFREARAVDFVIANGENVANGAGITSKPVSYTHLTLPTTPYV